jgi:prevent-host-death family protein
MRARQLTCHANRLVDKLVCMAHQTTVGVFDAKTHLNGLLKRVSKGETIRITRRGVPIAKLVPADAGEKEEPDQVVREIRELRKGATLGKITIRELINAGRRY